MSSSLHGITGAEPGFLKAGGVGVTAENMYQNVVHLRIRAHCFSPLF